MAIWNDMIQAYKGHYEDEILKDFNEHFIEHGLGKAKDERLFGTEWVKTKVESHSNKERLEIYCSWNGIIGYSNRLFEIATTGE